MAEFSEKSLKRLDTCQPLLRKVFLEVVKHFDCKVLCGYRDRAAQELAFDTGKSKAHYGESPHNQVPALAVDVVPYPVDWRDVERMLHFAGFVMGVANQMGIDLRWGGDWDDDTHLSDNRFDDLPHFELADWRKAL